MNFTHSPITLPESDQSGPANMSIKVKVQLHGEFRTAASELELKIPSGTEFRQLLTLLVEKLDENYRRKLFDSRGNMLSRPLLVALVNGVPSKLGQKLADRDLVVLSPLDSFGGG